MALNLIEILNIAKNENMDEDQIRIIMSKYLEHNAREKGIPLNGSFELTPYCNLDCKMCYAHLYKEQTQGYNLLSISSWKNIIDQAIASGMMNATLTGGECLLYEGFDEIYLYLIEKGIKVSVLTNGLLLNKKRISFFLQHKPKKIQVSIYGSNDEAYYDVTGKRCFNTVINNVVEARNQGINVTLAITPNKYMFNDFRNLLPMLEQLGIPYHINSKLILPRKETGREIADLTDEQYIEIYKFWNSLKSDKKQMEEKCEDVVLENDYKESVGLKCSGGRSQFLLRWDGKLCTCPSMSELGVYISNDNFVESWKQLNALANSYKIPGECLNCNLKRYCLICPAIHKNSEEIGHCDKRVCSRTIKMFKAGIFNKKVDNYD